MKLAIECLVAEEVVDLVDPLGDDEARTFVPLGDEVP